MLIDWLRRLWQRTPTRERLIWIGDGLAADGKQQIGRLVNIDGRTGKVVEATALTITVEWEG